MTGKAAAAGFSTLAGILLYQTEDGHTRVECRLAEESLWMAQSVMAELFRTTPQNITLHLKAFYLDELLEGANL